MLAQLSSKLCRSLGRGEVSSTMDSGLGKVETRDEVRRFLPSAVGPEERNTVKSKALKHRSASKSRFLPSEDTQQSPGTKQNVFAAAPTQNTQEKSSSCDVFYSASQGIEDANIQHTVWRPW